MSSTLARAHIEFLNTLCRDLLSVKNGTPNNADKGSKTSTAIALGLIKVLDLKPAGPAGMSGQEAGRTFEKLCARFLQDTFPTLRHLRPGKWEVLTGGKISRFEQFSHIEKLEQVVGQDAELAAILGREYQIAPDVVVARHLEPLENLNPTKGPRVVDKRTAARAILREGEGKKDLLLHASVSCKWTLRSDRAQNARSEALNLTRMRRGRVPHITVVTAEPLPSRLVSLALGTDIDCVYHIALDALIAATDLVGNKNETSALATMVNGKRLRDITDLPLDLCV